MDYFIIINTAIAGGALFLVLFLLLRYLSWSNTTQAPPEAGGAWPIIGHLHFFFAGGSSQLPHIKLASLADKHGPIFTVRIGARKAVVVSTSELAKDLFTTHDLAALSRPKLTAFKYLGYDFAMFNISPYGPYWRELRKIISLELFSTRRLELLKHVRVSETETSVNELYKRCEQSSSGDVVVDMKKWLGDLTLNVILRMVAGKRYFGDDNFPGDEEEARRCRKAMREFFHLMGVVVLGDVVPWLGWVDIGGYVKAMKMAAEEMDRICERWLQEHRQKKAAAAARDEKDFMDVMLSVVDGDANLEGFDPDTIVKSTCLVLIAGGTDTTSVMLVWTLSLLLNNRHALRKVQEELDVHIGKHRRVNDPDITKLNYLHAVVKESLRLYPAAPLSGPREFTQDCEISGYKVRKGTRLILNLWKLQRDPRVWDDPLEFKPERFLNAHKDIDVKGQHFELIPFGAGRRICPGTVFSLEMIHLVLANLIHAFDISTPFDEPVDMTESDGLTNIKATTLDVLISPRLSSTLY